VTNRVFEREAIRDEVRRVRISGTLLVTPAVIAGVLVSVPAGASSAAGDRAPAVLPLLTYVASNGGICLVRADGSHAMRLTPRWRVGGPAWSPSGRYVAFARGTGADRSKIVVADARGRIRWRFGVAQYNGGPLWSPDGRYIAYFGSWAHVYGLAVARMDGSADRGVVASPAFPSYGPADPAWVPGKQQLAFDDGNFVDTPQGIFTVAPDGSGRRLLVADARQPVFSPDGSKLAYVAFHNWQLGDLLVADADGDNARPLAAQSGNVSWGTPAWSPDGTRLAFTQQTLLYGRTVRTDLIIEAADGGGKRVLTSLSAPAALSNPVWSPDGRFVAFVRYPSRAVVVARIDNGGLRVVVAHSNGLPSWRPLARLPAARRRPCPPR
jgi:Tol biopolymer transport system component